MKKPTTIAVSPQATHPDRPFTLDAHKKAFRMQHDFPMDASYRLVSGTNPWRHNSLGWHFYEKVLRKHPVGTVQELVKRGIPHMIGKDELMEHLRWLFTWGGSYIEIAGELYTPPPEGAVVVPRPKKKVKAIAKVG